MPSRPRRQAPLPPQTCVTRACDALFAVVAREGQRPASMPAQGNALGKMVKIGQALKGRHPRCSALSGPARDGTVIPGRCPGLAWLRTVGAQACSSPKCITGSKRLCKNSIWPAKHTKKRERKNAAIFLFCVFSRVSRAFFQPSRTYYTVSKPPASSRRANLPCKESFYNLPPPAKTTPMPPAPLHHLRPPKPFSSTYSHVRRMKRTLL